MNERIRELEIEAIAYADSKVPAIDRYNDIYHNIVRGKFAELIVRECAGLDFRHKVGMTVQQDYDTSCVILEHFGLKL